MRARRSAYLLPANCICLEQAFSTFATDRGRIYELFEKYKALKLLNLAYDSPDRQVDCQQLRGYDSLTD